jgi:hypothetical protein
MSLFDTVHRKLQAIDVDQEVKEKAIMGMAHVIAFAGDHVADRLAAVWPLFLARLQNEACSAFNVSWGILTSHQITRTTATKALALIASSQLQIDIAPILVETIKVRLLNCLAKLQLHVILSYRNLSF